MHPTLISDEAPLENPSGVRCSKRPRSRKLEICLWGFSFLALGQAGWMWADSWFYQLRSSQALANMTARQPAGQFEGSENKSIAQPVVITPGMPIGKLEIPRLDISVVVAEGTSDRTLQRAIGHLESSAHPGEPGNVVLAGHRDTFFQALGDARSGDLVVLESAAGKDLFEVEWIQIVEPTAVTVAEETGYPSLTLITCYPFRYVGSAPQRFIVRARHVSGPAQKPWRAERESSPVS